MKQFEGKFSEAAFYKYITNKNCIVNDGSGSLYVYKKSEGMWIRTDEVKMKMILYKLIFKDIRISVKVQSISSIIQRLKCDPALSINFSEASDKNATQLNVRNGVIDLNTGRLHKHIQDGYFTYCLDFVYNETADIESSEAFMKFVRSSLNYDTDKCKTIRLLEMIGYIISSLKGAEKCFILVGASNSGKSVMLNLVEKVVGETNTTNIPINKLGDRFNIGELRYSRVNINREISGSELKNLDTFKSICSGERLTGEQKYANPFSFYCQCKLLFAGNCLPEIKRIDSSNNEAIFNRFCILYFSKGLTDEEKDLTLEEKLFEERDIIFSVAINTLMDLKKRNYVFTEDLESTKYLDNYKSSNQALKNFVNECCVIGSDMRIHTRDLIVIFKRYCTANAIEYRYTNESIKAYVSSLEGVFMKKFRMNGSAPLNGFIGIGLKSSDGCNDMEQD